MIMALDEKIGLYRDCFDAFLCAREGKDPAWLKEIREAAMRRFQELGLPTVAQEEWRYTNVAALRKTNFELPAVIASGSTDANLLLGLPLEKEAVHRLVFVDGLYAPGLSDVQGLPQGAQIGNLAGDWGKYLKKNTDNEQSAFAALNTAFMQDGAYVYLPKGCVMTKAVHLVFVTTASSRPIMTHPRNLIVAEENSQATIVETYVGSGDNLYFTNTVMQLIARDNARIEHCKLTREGEGAYHVAAFEIIQGRSSHVTAHSVALGGKLLRNDVRAILGAEGGDLTLNGLAMADGSEHMDNHTVIDHQKPHCNSRELYLGLWDGKSHGVFDGKIFVRQDAQKTNARQSNKNLILSDEALANTKPQLEIYADDVKCNHGATIGRLQEEALFYLRSRGIGQEEARAMMTHAFANEVVEKIMPAALRPWIWAA